jgi:2-keto-4-pentenoate hydratase/2-oxohepta-3-ene-1,7-dioic acid hydratase in catechol pathway
VFLFMAPHAVTGPYDDVAYPPDTERLDFELEIAAIVVRDVRDATLAEARAAIGGYLVMNDWSARDVQGKEMRLKLGPSKGKDFATTIGPWVVTADELDDARDADGFLDLAMEVRVNGRRVGADRSGHMGWSFEQLVSHASRASWVRAGEVLASGTCASGSLAESWGRTGRLDPPPLQVGDVVEMTIDRLGTVRNEVVAPAGSVAPVAPARRRTPAAEAV